MDDRTQSTTTTAVDATPRLRIDLWSDFACPWCYVGGARLEKAIATSPHADDIDLVIHSFELDARTSKTAVPVVGYLAEKIGVSTDRAVELEHQLGALAHREGLPHTLDRVHANSFDAHRVFQLGNSLGVGNAVFADIQRGLFGGRPDAYERSFLVEVAVDAGIPRARVEQVLDGDEFTADVREDEAQAQALGVTGVPFVVVDGRYGIPGALEQTGYAEVIEKVWNEL